ncbi:hypothetical protein Tco_1359715 [Tanacetum coccineum]
MNELNELLDQAYENSLIYKEKTKKIHDSKIKNRGFNVGDRVLLFNSGKLKTRWTGPFTIAQDCSDFEDSRAREIPSGEIKVHIEVLSMLWENRLPISDGSLPLSRYGYVTKRTKTKQNGQNRAREWKERMKSKPKAVNHSPHTCKSLLEDLVLTPLTFTKATLAILSTMIGGMDVEAIKGYD